MRHKMKKFLSLFLAFVLVSGYLVTPAEALVTGFKPGSGVWELYTETNSKPEFIHHQHSWDTSIISDAVAKTYDGTYWRVVSNVPSTQTTEGYVTLQCTACDTQATFKIPRWNDSMYSWVTSGPEYYDGETQVNWTFSVPTPNATVTTDDGSKTWTHRHLIALKGINMTPSVENAGIRGEANLSGSGNAVASTYPYDKDTGAPLTHMKIDIIKGNMHANPIEIKPRTVKLTVPSIITPFTSVSGGKFVTVQATGYDLLPSLSNFTYPNYKGTATKASVYVHAITDLQAQADDPTKVLYVGKQYVTDESGAEALSSVTEPGLYYIDAVLPQIADPNVYAANYTIDSEALDPAWTVRGSVVKTENLSDPDLQALFPGRTWNTWYIANGLLFVAPQSVKSTYVGHVTGKITTYPESTYWDFYADYAPGTRPTEDDPATDINETTAKWDATAGTKDILLIAVPKGTTPDASGGIQGIPATTAQIEVKKWNIEAIMGTPTASNATPAIGTAFADLGLPADVQVKLETPPDETLAPGLAYTSTVKVVWDESSWDPTNPNQQVVIGHLDMVNDKRASRAYLDPNHLVVQVTITPKAALPAEIVWPDKTVEYTGSPIPHEITSATGVASATYRYVNTKLGYDSANPPTAVGTYQVTATFTMQPGYAQLAPATSVLKITKQSQALPDGVKPEKDYATPTTIGLKPGPGAGPWLYGIVQPDGNIKWQPGTEFTDLMPNTEYRFVMKIAGSDTKEDSPVSEEVPISTISVNFVVDVSATAASVKYPETITLSARTTHNLGAKAVVTYQWYKAGKEVAGATNSTLMLTAPADSGTYTCKSTVTLGAYTISKTSSSLTVEILGGSAEDLLPENWKDYLLSDPITYGNSLSQTNLRLDMARLIRENPSYTLASTVSVDFTNRALVPTVDSSKTGTGTYGIVLRSSNSNYPTTTSSTIKETDITVNPAPLEISMAPVSITYGADPIPAIARVAELRYNGFVNHDTAASLAGTITYTSTYNTQWQDIPTGGSAEVTMSGLRNSNYNISYLPGTLTISPLTVHVVLAYKQSKYFGDTDPKYTITAQNISMYPADVQTDIQDAVNDVPVTRDAGEDVGTYNFQVPDTVVGNFKFVRYTLTPPETFSILPRRVEVIWEMDDTVDPSAMSAYAAPDIPDFSDWTFDYTASDSVIRDFNTYVAAKEPISIVRTPDTDFPDETARITASYNDVDGNKLPVRFKLYKNDTEALFNTPGLYIADATNGIDDDNYELVGTRRQFAYKDATKTENVTFPIASPIYVGDPLGSSTLTGGNGGTPGNGTYQWKDPTYEPALGTASFDVVFTPDPADDTDYSTELGYDPETNTITRPVTVTVRNRVAVDPDSLDITSDKVYDGTVNAEIDASNAIQIDPNFPNVTITVTARYENPNAGEDKPIHIKVEVTGPDADKYIVPDEFTVVGKITPAPLTIKANDVKLQFGDEMGKSGVTVTGLVNDETLADLEGTLEYSYDGYERWDDVFTGTKRLSVSGLSSNNYNITYEDGTFEIEKRMILILPDIENYKFYGDPEPDYSYTVDYGFPGAAPDKVKAEIEGNPIVITRDPGEDVGNYKFHCDIPETTNFVWVIDETAEFVISARPVDLTWEGVNKAYYDDGTNQGSNIAAWYTDINGKKVYTALTFTMGSSETPVLFKDKGIYTITARDDDPNYEINNPTTNVIMGDKDAQNSLLFPFAVPILKGEDLGKSNLLGGKGNGDFAWVDPTVVPDATGDFPVRFTPAAGEDVTAQPGYDPETGTVIRDVNVEVWDKPKDLDDPDLWDEMQRNGIFDKLYDAVTDSPLTGAKVDTVLADDGHYIEHSIERGVFAANVNVPEALQKAFLTALYKEHYQLFLDLVGYNMLTMNTTGTFASKDVADNVALHMELALTGPAARLFKLSNHDTTGDIGRIMLMAVANDQTMTSLIPPFGAGVTFPDTLNRTEPKGYTWQDPAGFVYTFGLRNPDTMAALKGTLGYKFAAIKADGTEVLYSVDEMYAVPVWVIPNGLTSDNYDIHFFPGRLYAPNIIDPNEDPNWPSGRPDAPTIKETTTTTIEVNPINGGQYSIDGGKTWQNSPIFEGLTPDTEYQIIQRIPDKNNAGEYLVSDPTTAKTRDPNDNPNRPNPPQIESKTDTTITVKPIPNGEYSIDNGKTWQPDPTFPGLTPDTEYEIIQRIPDPENPNEYLVSDPTKVKTDDTFDLDKYKPAKPVIDKVTDTVVGVKPIPNGQYSIDGGMTWQDSPIFRGLTPDTQYEVIQRVPNPQKPDEYLVSDPTPVKTLDENPNKPPKPEIKDKSDTTIEVKPIPDGEYSIDGGKTWQPDPTFPGLTPDTEYEIIQRIPDPDNPGEYIESDPTNVKTDPENKLPKPEIEDVTDTTIIVKPIEGGEYSIDGGNTWQTDPVFPGLRPGTEYEIIQRIPDPNKPGDFIVSPPTNVTTDPDGDSVPRPIILDKKPTSITIQPIDNGQYSIDGGMTWQPGPYFPGLTPGTTYDVVQRVPDGAGGWKVSPVVKVTTPTDRNWDDIKIDKPSETIDFPDGKYEITDKDGNLIPDGGKIEPGETIHVKDKTTGEETDIHIPPRPAAPDVKLDNETGIINTKPGMEYSPDGGKTWYPAPDGLDVNDIIDGEIWVRFPATEDNFSSEITKIPIHRPAAPVVDSIDVSKPGASDGAIIGTTTDMEYSTDGGKTWHPCTDGLVNNLPQGTYLVRYKGTPDHLASLPTTVVIGVRKQTPGTGDNGDDESPDDKYGHFVQPGRPNLPNSNNGNTSGDTIILDSDVALGTMGTCPSEPYVDIDQSQWYHDPADFTIANRLMIGFNATEWGPTRQMTRFQMVQVLYRLAGAPTGYSLDGVYDVSRDSWYYNALAWAYHAGMVKGVSDTLFAPDDSITYEQMATMIYNFCNIYGLTYMTGTATTSYDANEVADYAKAPMTAISATGIFNVRGTTSVSAKGTMSRATAAQIVTNFCTLYNNQMRSNDNISGATVALYTNPGVMSAQGIRYT